MPRGQQAGGHAATAAQSADTHPRRTCGSEPSEARSGSMPAGPEAWRLAGSLCAWLMAEPSGPLEAPLAAWETGSETAWRLFSGM